MRWRLLPPLARKTTKLKSEPRVILHCVIYELPIGIHLVLNISYILSVVLPEEITIDSMGENYRYLKAARRWAKYIIIISMKVFFSLDLDMHSGQLLTTMVVISA